MPLPPDRLKYVSPSGVTAPIGSWPSNWVDTLHEPDGGLDMYGSRPQRGIELLQSELDALTMRNSVSVARYDVSGAELDPEWVAQARHEELTCVRQLGVCSVVPRSH
mgnify:CR=1 FL=1